MGGQLYDMLKKDRRLTEPLTADIIQQVCLGVDAIHREKIIHRDIKPENVIMHEVKYWDKLGCCENL